MSKKISELDPIVSADVSDILPIVDVSLPKTKKITVENLKASMGLDEVDNTSDLDKPVSAATQEELDKKLEVSDIEDFETSEQLDDRDTANRDRANHTGTQDAATIDGLAPVATSGDYSDLTNTPTIPDVSEFETSAQLDDRDVANRDRANHTGTQDVSTVDGLADVATSGDYSDLINTPAIPDVSEFETSSQLDDRDTANRDRANHTGTQDVSTVDGLADVAISGDYDDLINTPTIPDVSEFETSAQLDDRDAANRDRANHTGTQDISTIDNLQDKLDEITGFKYEQIIYVDLAGDDSNVGSLLSPFKTLPAAMASITDASPSKRYAISVGAGSHVIASDFELKANVFILGQASSLASRIQATSFKMAADFSGSADNRSGFSSCTLVGPCNFDWADVTSSAGRLYFSNVSFNSALTLTGHNNAIAQAQLFLTTHFGNFTVSGINLLTISTRFYSSCFMNQHPSLPTVWEANGGSCGALTITTTVSNFNRRCSMFAKSFYMDSPLLVDGPVSYCDYTTSSLPLNNSTANGGQLIPLNPSTQGANTSLSNLAFPTAVNQPIMPANSNATNFGDWGKQWFWNFGYVHASTGTDLFLISYPSSFGADPGPNGKSIGIYTDGAGLAQDVNGGNIVLQTAAVSGTGVRGKVTINARELDLTGKKLVGLADGTNPSDAVNKGQLDDAIDSIPQGKDVIEFDEIGEAPIPGEVEKIYVAKDDNKIYRFEEIESGGLELPEVPAEPSFTVTTSITDSDDLQATVNAASPGDVIFLANGTYNIAANLIIDKALTLLGESQAGVLIQDTRGNAQSFVSVSADNVVLKDLTIRQSTTESNIGTAIIASGPGFPQVRLDNFRMYNVKSQYSKGGLSVRSDNFVVQGCTFEVVAGSGTRRGILHYGNGGDSFIKDCVFINATTGALRAVCPTSTSGSNPSDDQAGTLTVEGSTFSGNLSQFINMDNHQGAAGAFELIVMDNVTPETNAFVVSFGGVANFGDVFSRIVLIDNTLTNNHAAGLGKGVLAIDGLNGPLAYRSSPLPVVSVGNVLGQLSFRSGYAEALGSSGSIVGYATAQISQPTVEITEGEPSLVPAYIELSPSPKSRSGEVSIADNASSVSVTFSSDIGTSDYAISYCLVNTVDSNPKYIDKIVTAKSSSGFTISFHQPTDSANFKLNYFVQVFA